MINVELTKEEYGIARASFVALKHELTAMLDAGEVGPTAEKIMTGVYMQVLDTLLEKFPEEES